jgi:hypothetical protein
MIVVLAVAAAATLAVQQEPVHQYRPVFGEVRDTSGTPLANVEVLALDEGRLARTGADGTFRLDSIAFGEQRFLFRQVGYHRIEVSLLIRPAAEEIVIRMTPVAVVLDPVMVSARRTGVFGVVGDARYQALAGVEVLVVGGGSAITDSSGQFNLPRVRAGTYMLRVRKRGYYALTRSLTLPRDDAMELSLLLMPLPGGLSRGRVTQLSGYSPRLGWALAESDSRQMRCRGGSSVLVTREELAEQGEGSLADALTRTRTVSSKAYGRMELLQYRVIIDGQNYPGAPAAGVPLDDFRTPDEGWPLAGLRVEEVEAVEIYKGRIRLSRPSGRSSNFGGCPTGTIWVWLR